MSRVEALEAQTALSRNDDTLTQLVCERSSVHARTALAVGVTLVSSGVSWRSCITVSHDASQADLMHGFAGMSCWRANCHLFR